MKQTKYRVRIVEHEAQPGCGHISDIPGFTGDNVDACENYAIDKLDRIMDELWRGPVVRKSIIEHMNPNNLCKYENGPCIRGIYYRDSMIDQPKVTSLFTAITNEVIISDDDSLIHYLGFYASKFEDDWYITMSSGRVLDKIPQEESGSIDDVLDYMDKNYPFIKRKENEL